MLSGLTESNQNTCVIGGCQHGRLVAVDRVHPEKEFDFLGDLLEHDEIRNGEKGNTEKSLTEISQKSTSLTGMRPFQRSANARNMV